MITITKEIISNIKAIINTPDKWCQNRLLNYNSDGSEIKQACLLGAIYVSTGCLDSVPQQSYVDAIQFLYQDPVIKESGVALSGYNDTHTHEEIMALLDRAYARAA
jgi:hypothetical protein